MVHRSVTVGEAVELPCNVTGSPPPRVTWQKGTRSFAGTFTRETDSPPGQFLPSDISPYIARLGLELRVGLVGLGLG